MPTKQLDKYASQKGEEDKIMFRVRRMTSKDIEFAVRITDTMNWNLTEQEFTFMMQLEPEGCFIILCNSEKVGITTTINFGKVGWIGNVIVDEKHRKKGAGSIVLKHAIAYLKGKGAETIGLYSYKEKVNFYTRLGFKRDLEFLVLNGKAFPSNVEEKNVKEAGKVDIKKIADFDSFYFGASREKLLEKIALEKGNLCLYYVEGGEVFGYVMAKVYDDYAEIGPLACKEEKNYAANLLLKVVLNKLNGFEVSMCLPKKEDTIISMLLKNGFKESFDVVRMFSGPLVFKECVYIAESLERG
jgi:GNAT superfamily N-acetyltransferase